jgi:hypothetical protein
MIDALYGFFAAVTAIMLLSVIWSLAKVKLERWTYDLNRETHNRLRETDMKIDSIQRGQERLLSQLERMERRTGTS